MTDHKLHAATLVLDNRVVFKGRMPLPIKEYTREIITNKERAGKWQAMGAWTRRRAKQTALGLVVDDMQFAIGQMAINHRSYEGRATLFYGRPGNPLWIFDLPKVCVTPYVDEIWPLPKQLGSMWHVGPPFRKLIPKIYITPIMTLEADPVLIFGRENVSNVITMQWTIPKARLRVPAALSHNADAEFNIKYT